MNAMEIDCPWCAGEGTVETGATQAQVATFVCPDCMVRVELAPDPSVAVTARAA